MRTHRKEQSESPIFVVRKFRGPQTGHRIFFHGPQAGHRIFFPRSQTGHRIFSREPQTGRLSAFWPLTGYGRFDGVKMFSNRQTSFLTLTLLLIMHVDSRMALIVFSICEKVDKKLRIPNLLSMQEQ